ncbi:hypothetical protein RMCBS344292_10869 [Rhizopus microsporus]|nr:hypothetical protein RMCBS344292_10869 [Rhizopus microsporus]
MNKNGLPIHMTSPETLTPTLTIHVDASNTGWGVKSEILEISGYWTEEEKETSINVRERKTIYFALKLHAPSVKNSTIRLFSHNQTALKYVMKTGGTASYLLQILALQIQELTNDYNLNVLYHRIPGVESFKAD